MTIRDKLDELVRQILRSQVKGYYHPCFVCERKKYHGNLTVGHFRKRRHEATRWDLLNCHLLCPDCQDESKPENEERYAMRLDEVYGYGTAEMLTIKSHQLMRYTYVDYVELYEQLKKCD